MLHPRNSKIRSKRELTWEIKGNVTINVTFMVWRGRLLFYSYSCWYWIKEKLNVLDYVYLNSAITYSTGKSFWGVDLILLSTQSIFSIFLFYKGKSSGCKKYLDATLKLWLQSPNSWEISNSAHVFMYAALQDLLLWNQHTAPGKSILLEDVKKSVLPVKNTHR